jgi:hypothetical protein
MLARLKLFCGPSRTRLVGKRHHMPDWYSLVMLCLLWPLQAHAHDIYSHLTDERGRSCCDNSDCRPTHYRITALGVEMLIDERWLYIPRGAIQYRSLQGDNGESAGGHWCGDVYEGITYCAFLPPNVAMLAE